MSETEFGPAAGGDPAGPDGDSDETPRILRRDDRVGKWDRPPPPHDWRFYVGNVGKVLITVGLLLFGFVGYQLYGTGIETAAAQNSLESEFEERLAELAPTAASGEGGSPTSTSDTADDIDSADVMATEDDIDTEDDIAPTTVDPDAVTAPADEVDDVVDDSGAPVTTSSEPTADEVTGGAAVIDPLPATEQKIPDGLENGDALFRLEIPKIGVDDIVVAGVDTGALKRGPGHFPDTPLPGQLGNAAVAGHRTTYGQPFRNVDQLANGDEIRVTTLDGVFVYRVTGQAIVAPSEYQVVSTTDPTVANLTLTSCHPVFTARERIVIFSELDPTRSAPVGAPVINYGRDVPVESPVTIPGDEELVSTEISEPRTDDSVTDSVATTPATSPAATPVTTAAATDAGDVTEATIDPATDDEVAGDLIDGSPGDIDQLGTASTNDGIADAFGEGWFSDPSANLQVGLWGAGLAAIAVAASALSRRFRNDLVGLAIGIAPFTLALYFFFQNVNRLLPPNL